VDIGKPVQLVSVPEVGVPKIGVTKVGEVASALAPLPVEVVTPVPPFATGKVPVTPVVKGKPVQFVSVPELGVPKIGVTKVGEGAIEVTPVLEMVMAPVTATAVGTFELLPTRMLPLDMVASFECAIAAEALISAFRITPDAMEATPVLEMVTSPVRATDVGTFALLPTRTFPLVRVASLLNEIAALDATEALTTEPADGVLTPMSEMVKV
jgi:hypothetical protein